MLAKDRQALVKIVTPNDPTPQEQYAATELRKYLNLMTAAGFDIVKEADIDKDEPRIALAGAASSIGVTPNPNLGEDGFTIKTTGNNIGIAGNKRGIIYGVYELLEILGCRFFTPLCEKVPTLTDLALPLIDTTQKPVLEYRCHQYQDLRGVPTFAVKSRVNGSSNIPEKIGGSLEYVWFVHTFEDCLIHPDEYYDEHPEYFSLVKGKRLREMSQLCLTNPDVLKITIEKTKKALREQANPNRRIISISMNDWYNPCECPTCAEIDEREESRAGSLIAFVNQVAEAVVVEFPDAIIDTLAYIYARQAPKTLRPHPSVCVRLCSIEACFSHPLDKCDDITRNVKRPDGSSTPFIQDLNEWAKVCDRLYVWNYATCFAHYPTPHPNWGVLQPNIQTYVKNNVKGIFEQGCCAMGGSTDLNELRTYLICKLMWNADCDYEAHMKEFCEYFYGAAAPFILKYIQTLVDKVERDNIHIGFNDNTDRLFLTDDMLDIYDAILADAEAAVSGDAIRHVRVMKARLSIRWVRMKNNQMLKNEINPKEVNDFFTEWKALGLTRIDEWCDTETTLHAFLKGKWRGIEFFHHWTDQGRERYL